MKFTFGAAALATIVLAAGCSPTKKDLVTIDGQKINDEQVSAYLMQGPEAKDALRSLMQESLLVEAAKKDNIKVTDADVNLYLQFQRDQYPPNSLDESFATKGATPARIQRDAKKVLLQMALEMQGATVSDDSIKKAYDADASGMFTKPEWVQIGVLVAKDRADADMAVKSLKDGVTFDIVHGKFSAPGAKGQGTNYQWVPIVKGNVVDGRRQPLQGLDPALKSALLKTKEATVSAPIASPGRPGVTLIYVKKRVPSGKIPLEEVKTEIAYEIARQNNQTKPAAFKELVDKAKIDIAVDQFKNLSKPESLIPPQADAPTR